MMKKYGLFLSALSVLLCLTITGCSNDSSPLVISEIIPENVINIEASGFYNGSDLEPWELTQAEIEDLGIWLNQLSLEHKTYAEGEAPNEVWNGGASYSFNINNGEQSFTWSFIDKAYIWYDGEWYEIVGTSTPPLDLAV